LLEDPKHLPRNDGGARREYVPELAEHDVERAVGIGERFGVALDKVDIDRSHAGIVTGALK
jgi:hypothetical protein